MHPTPPKNPSRRKIRILVATRIIPVENSTGARAYLLGLLKYLKRRGSSVELVLVDSSPGGESPIFFISPAVHKLGNVTARNNIKIGRLLFRYRPLVGWLFIPLGVIHYLLPESHRESFRNTCRTFLRNARMLLFRDSGKNQLGPRIMDYLATRNELDLVRERSCLFETNVVIANYAWLADIFEVLPQKEKTLKVIVTHDIIHQRLQSAKKLGISLQYSSWDRNKESRLLQKADILLAIQEEDAQTLKKMAPMADVINMPMPALPHVNRCKQVPGRCFFVGSNGYANVHGLYWFLRQVWPLVLDAVPHCSLHICGTVCREIEGDFPRVAFLGRIEELGDQYDQAEVCLAPLHFGSGLKIKLIEALSYGRACISTSVGLQGLRELEGRAVLLADTPEEFSASVTMVLMNQEERAGLERKARSFVEEKLAPEKVYQPFLDRLEAWVKFTAGPH